MLKVNEEAANLKGLLIDSGCLEQESSNGVIHLKFGAHVLAKECIECGELKRVEEFPKRPNGLGKRRAECRECRSEYFKIRREARKIAGNVYEEGRKEVKRIDAIRWRLNNPERKKENHRRWNRENRHKKSEADQRRRAIKKKLPADETLPQRTEVWMYFRNSCALTGELVPIHADHVVPIDVGHGGTNYGNMIPLSAVLNVSKNASHIYEWFEANAERFGLSREKFDALIEYLADANEMTTQEYRKYVDWCFDNPRTIDEATGELVFERDLISEREAIA